LSFVLMRAGLYETAARVYPWMAFVEAADCLGPREAAERLHTTREVLRKTKSSIEAAILSELSQASEVLQGEPLYTVLQYIGRDLLEYPLKYEARLAWLEDNARFLELKPSVRAMVIDQRVSEPGLATEEFRYRQSGAETIAVSIVPDDRDGIGWSLFRFDDHPKVDFCRLEGDPAVEFVHASGFLAKTSGMDVESAVATARKAVR